MTETATEKFNNLSHQGHANQNYSESPSYTCQMAKIKNTINSLCWEDVEQEHSSIAGGSENLYSHFGNQYDSF